MDFLSLEATSSNIVSAPILVKSREIVIKNTLLNFKVPPEKSKTDYHRGTKTQRKIFKRGRWK